jgi:Fe2+ or Zn2+ uptake regulation protein
MKHLKNSKQRDIILNAVKTSTTHPTADELYQEIKVNNSNISLATVYRNLNLLYDMGQIKKISMASSPDRFDKTTADHYHVYCTKCNKVCDVTIKEISDAARKVEDLTGYGNVDYDIVFTGICPECQNKE